MLREIIDESDVFIDVHKAIRRMAPAPRYRVPKGKVVAAPETVTITTEDLIDLDDEHKEPTRGPTRFASSDGNILKVNGSHAESGIPPKAVSNVRRTSSIGGASDREIPLKRANTMERREHLKHLGPSNLASRPRQTRYNTVKIKPGGTGGTAVADNDSKSREPSEASRILSPTPAPQGGVGAGLATAGKEAKDGVLALQAGYGTTGLSPKISNGTTKAREHDESGSTPPQEDKYQSENSPTARAGRSTTSLGSLQKRDSGSPKSRKIDHIVRSGSITENIIDAGGIKKTVLEMTSSSSDDVEDNGAATASAAANDSRGSQSPSEATAEEQADGKENDTGGKKKRRRKKRKGGKSDEDGGEDTPLLGRQP